MSDTIFQYLKNKFSQQEQLLDLFNNIRHMKSEEVSEAAAATNMNNSQLLAQFSQLYVQLLTPQLLPVLFNMKYNLFKEIQQNGYLLNVQDLHKRSKQLAFNASKKVQDNIDIKSSSKFLIFFLANFSKSIQMCSLVESLNAEIIESKLIAGSFQEEYQNLLQDLITQLETGEELCQGEDSIEESYSELSYDEHDCCSDSYTDQANEI